MSDTWKDIQELKNRQLSFKEKLLRRKKEREGLVAELAGESVSDSPSSSAAATATGTNEDEEATAGSYSPTPAVTQHDGDQKPCSSNADGNNSKDLPARISTTSADSADPALLAATENQLQLYLSDVTLEFPIDVRTLITHTNKHIDTPAPDALVHNLLQKFAAQQLISLGDVKNENTKEVSLHVTAADHSKLAAFIELNENKDGGPATKKRKTESSVGDGEKENGATEEWEEKTEEPDTPGDSVTVEGLLSMQSAKERETKKLLDEIQHLLSKPTAKEQSIVEKFKSQGGAQVQGFCQYGTKNECMKMGGQTHTCEKLHFKKIIKKHTDETLGDCSFLNTCFHMEMCKYVHYEISYLDSMTKHIKTDTSASKSSKSVNETKLFPPQWLQCDMRYLDMSVLGKFAVIMADPPWDIHMELPYGTMSDDEMRKLPVPILQDDGYIFLWVTGRAMELGRECLQLWGYERVDELIWVKTNQLQRIIRTGRTGHWLNHGKEHCLVGLKGNPQNMNRGLDCDVIVAEVRATSHKPDEIYGIIERLSPGSRKIELFGRAHNVQPNWITVGNQVDGVRLLEPEVVNGFKKRYPDGNCMKPPAKTH